MTTFSTNANTTWRGEGVGTAISRTENVRELLNNLNFSSIQYVNYDVPLDDTSDKVAYTLAMKYIKNKDGGTDTLDRRSYPRRRLRRRMGKQLQRVQQR